MSGMVQVSGAGMIGRLRAFGVSVRNGLGGVLDGWWAPAWVVEVCNMCTGDGPEGRAVLAWIAQYEDDGSRKWLPRSKLESVRGNDERLEQVRAVYLIGGWPAVSALAPGRPPW